MSPTASNPGLFARFWALSWKVKLLALVLIPIALFYAVVLSANMFNYAVGERTGVLSKISNKGFLCWTFEGELAQPSFSKPGTLGAKNAPIDNTFYFSVPDDDVRKQLDAVSPGSPVALQYEQKVFDLALPLPFLCRRRTQYEITGVKLAPAYDQPGNVARPIEPPQ